MSSRPITCGNITARVVLPHVVGMRHTLSTGRYLTLRAKVRVQTEQRPRKDRDAPCSSDDEKGGEEDVLQGTVPEPKKAAGKCSTRKQECCLIAPLST